jgi:2-polyprenyl-3-methyl-5-hydroxy-6-metoxy-1,4-benzoquinol methylase
MAKIDEILYPERLDSLEWLRHKPFGGAARLTAGHLRDFGNILELLDLAPGARVLDLGVGSGWTSRWLARAGYTVVGVDIAPRMIELAAEQARLEGLAVEFRAEDVEALADRHELGSFDACLAYDMLHHVERLDLVLRGVAARLRPGGRLLAVEPNWNHARSPESREAVRRYGVREEGIAPRRLRRVLRQAGFRRITRYHCADGLYGPGPLDVLKHLLRPLLHRLIKAHYATRVWMLAVR